MANTSEAPRERPNYGTRLLTQTLDSITLETPERVYASIPISENVSDGFRDVTFRDVANGVNYFAHQLESLYGRSSCHETLMYVGIPDLRYIMVFLGAIKCGYKTLLPSPRNTASVNLSLLEQTQCTKVFYSKEVEPLVKALRAGRDDLFYVGVGSFEEFIFPAQRFDYNEAPPEAMKIPIVVLHSSGSTGLPKPVTMTHGTFASLDNDHNLPLVPGRLTQDFTLWDMGGQPGKVFQIFPPFHLAGFVIMTMGPVFGFTCPVIGPPTRPPTGELISEIMKQQDIRGLFIPPSIAEQLLNEPEGLDQFKKLDFLCYAGGPLSRTTGEVLRDVTVLRQFYGSTEFVRVPQLVADRDDFEYLEWNPHAKFRMEPAEDDAFELVVLTEGKGESPLDYHFPRIKEYHTKDLFRQHPSKAGLWKFHGRRDDILVLSNGEKFNPVPIETALQGNPLVAGALVIGQGRFQAALLIEGKTELDDSSFLDTIWPTVQAANRLVPGQGRISRDKIRLATAEKPFVRAGKGTIVRRLTEKLYEEEIASLYALSDAPPESSSVSLRATFTIQDVTDFVKYTIKSVFPDTDVGIEVDLYSLGLDSLKTIEIIKSLKSELQKYRQPSQLSWVDPGILYQNPTIDQLSEKLVELLNFDTGLEAPSSAVEMSALFTKYTADLPFFSSPSAKRSRPALFEVAIVGTSGFLGSNLLNQYLSDPKISKVYCLSRSNPPANAKVQFFQVDYSKENLGLTQSQSHEVGSNCDVIFFNSWKVNFNQALQSFEDNIRNLRSVIEITATSQKIPRLVFVSSVSATGQWEKISGGTKVPERPMSIDESSAALPMGYAQSKLVAEAILLEAGRRNLPVTILRIGQIAGSTSPISSTVWPSSDWFPLTVATSKSIGMLPQLGKIDWIPIDVLIGVVAEILHHDLQEDENSTYNLVNPNEANWDDLLDPLKACCGSEATVVSATEWLQRIKELELREDAGEQLPMTKMLDTVRLFIDEDQARSVPYETGRAAKASPGFANAPQITKTMMEKWVKDWKF